MTRSQSESILARKTRIFWSKEYHVIVKKFECIPSMVQVDRGSFCACFTDCSIPKNVF